MISYLLNNFFYWMTCRILVNCRFGLSHCVLTNTYFNKVVFTWISDEQGDDESMEMSSSQPSHVIYEKEAAIEIDYNTLEEGKCTIVYATKLYTYIYMAPHLYFDRALRSKVHILSSGIFFSRIILCNFKIIWFLFSLLNNINTIFSMPNLPRGQWLFFIYLIFHQCFFRFNWNRR